MDTVLTLDALTKRYTADEIPPVADLSLTLHRGDFVAVEGPSGMGKSTLLYLMGGLIRPTSGTITFRETQLTALNDRALTKWRQEELAFIFQETILFAALTARENLMEAMKLHRGIPRGQRAGLAAQYLERMGLSDRADHLPHQLSVGQRRRLIIARALMGSHSLILADEPTNDLDDLWAETVIDLLAERAREGCCVVMVTHNDKWARRASSRYLLEHGQLHPSQT